MKKIGLALSIIFAFLIAVPLASACKGVEANITCYEIDCSLNGNQIDGVETVEFINHTDNTVSELKFNLYANAFRKGAKFSPISSQYFNRAYPNGVNYGNITINEVFVEGVKADFKICGEDDNILSVILFDELFPDERVKVKIDYNIILADVIARTGINSKTINLANFYPILCALTSEGFYECVYYSSGDPYYSDCANYKVKFTCDSEYVVASSGKVDGVKNLDGKTEWIYSINNARSFCMVLSKEFETVLADFNGTSVCYYFYKDENPNKSMEYAIKSLDYFTKTFGEYPYPTYSVVQTEFIQGGMEFPALVMISDNLEPQAYGEVIVHETAHQWWQTVVGNNEIEYGFLDEGLAEYSVVLFFENHPEYGLTREAMIRSSESTYRVFCSVYDKLFGNLNTSMLRSLKDFTSEYEYVNIAYIKTCVMYDYLRQTIGEERFFKGLKKYYDKFKFENAMPYDIVGVFEKIGADTNGFFQSFYEGKVII